MSADAGGGYTGVVYSSVAAPYTGAEGYTGVAYTEVGAGLTGLATQSGRAAPAAPVTAANAPPPAAPNPAAPTDAGEPPVTPSPYDQTLVPPDSAPGSGAATDYATPAPTPTPDDLEAIADETAAAALSTPRADTHVDLIDGLVDTAGHLDRQIRLSPQPEPNQAVAMARDLLRGMPPPAHVTSSRDLMGSLADWMKGQVSQAIASARPSTLAQAYLQGILQEAVSSAIDTGVDLAGNTVDPVGTRIDKARQMIASIQDQMSQGEGFWEAVNSTLNPAVALLEQGYMANQLAGQALAASQRGDPDQAVRLARLAGRSAVRGGEAAAGTVVTAEWITKFGSKAAKALRPPPATQMPAPPPLPERPESAPLKATREPSPPPSDPPPRTGINGVAPRPDGLTGTVVHGEPGTAPPAPAAAAPYGAFPEVTVPDRAFLRTALGELSDLYRAEQGRLARKMQAVPPNNRLDTKNRNVLLVEEVRLKEEMTTIQNQLAHPDRAYLTQPRLDVVPATGPVISGADVPGVGEGRVGDELALHPDGTFGVNEFKPEASILDAYSKRGGATGSRFKRSTRLGDQLARQQKIIDFARSKGYMLRITARPLQGGPPVSIILSPDAYRGAVVSAYFQLEN